MDEEKMIIEQVLEARYRLKLHQQEVADMKFKTRKLELELQEVEQALIDYMEGNGLVKTENVILSESQSIEVADINAVPEEFLRIKKEPNKILIKEMSPQGNWYTIQTNKRLTIKGSK